LPEGVSEEIEFVKDIGPLRLDPRNPRLPDEAKNWSQDQLLAYIEAEHEPIMVGRSMSRFGFFASEPMIVVTEEGEELVVEGNRRLVALRLLTEEGARELVPTEEWEELSDGFALPKAGVPIVRAESRDAVAPIIGYRHIAGIQDWDPLPKARFITSFIDEEGESFARVAELVGESEGDVRRFYRNYSVIEQAKGWGLDTSRAARDFGVFDRALVGGIREYIGAPPPSWMAEKSWPLEETDQTKERLGEVLSWMYGDPEHDAIVKDSRAITRLSQVLRSSDGAAVLRRTRDLTAAEEAAGGPRARLLERLGTAVSALNASRQDLPDHKADAEVVELVRSCHELVESLREMMDD
jgi:hypothetical protein